MDSEADYYSILGVPRDASDAEIRRAFRALAKEYHPDSRQAGSDAPSGRDFSVLTEAYETLKDSARRAAYDDELNQARQLSATPSKKKRPYAFAAGLGVGVLIAAVAVGAVTYLDRYGRRSGDKAQDSLRAAAAAASENAVRAREEVSPAPSRSKFARPRGQNPGSY